MIKEGVAVVAVSEMGFTDAAEEEVRVPTVPPGPESHVS